MGIIIFMPVRQKKGRLQIVFSKMMVDERGCTVHQPGRIDERVLTYMEKLYKHCHQIKTTIIDHHFVFLPFQLEQILGAL